MDEKLIKKEPLGNGFFVYVSPLHTFGTDAVLLAKNVDGVYSADPAKHPEAVKYDCLTYGEALAKRLKATDTTAMALAMDNHMPLIVFALKDPENILRVVQGENIGTIVKED